MLKRSIVSIDPESDPCLITLYIISFKSRDFTSLTLLIGRNFFYYRTPILRIFVLTCSLTRFVSKPSQLFAKFGNSGECSFSS